METGWDSPELEEFAAVLSARRQRALSPEREASRAACSAEWFLARVGEHEQAEVPIRARLERPTGEGPGDLKVTMMECQKPFHLWNVNRVEESGRIGFEEVPRYVVGAAASEGDRECRPGRVVPASRVVLAAHEDKLLLRADAFGAGRRLRQLLSEKAEENGLGVADVE